MNTLTEAEIDAIVVAEANNFEQWEAPISIRLESATTVTLPAELTSRARFFAKLHKKPSMEAWLQAIIQERIAFEESAYANLKQTIAT